MNIRNITQAANLSKELDRQEHFVSLLEEEAKYNELIVKTKNGYSGDYTLTREMRQALLEIARRDKESIIKKIEAL